MTGFDDLIFRVIADTKSAQEGLQQLSGKIKDLNNHALETGSSFEKFTSRLKIGAGIAAAAFTAAATAIGVFAVKAAQAAAESAQANAQLELTIKNVTGATDAAAKSASEYIRQLNLATGVSQNALRPALDQLVRSTKNLSDAQKLLRSAMDVSAGTGIDQLTIATALGQAYNGNYTSLGKLKLGLKESTLATGDFKKVMEELNAIFAGQAQAQADSFLGQVNRLKAAMSDMQEKIGTMVVPAFQLLLNILNKGVIPAIDRYLQYLSKNPKAVENLVKAMAWAINFFAEFGNFVVMLADGFVQFLWIITRVVQGIGWITGQKGLKDWGRETSESLEGVNKKLVDLSIKLHNFDANKYLKGIDFKINLDVKPIGAGDFSGATPPGGAKATLAKDWNDAAKAILDAAKKIRSGLQEVLSFNLKQQIEDLSVDPLVKSLKDAKLATADYAKAQDRLVQLTKASAMADLEYVKSMTDVTDKGKARTVALKDAVDTAKEAALSAANDTQAALQRIQDAQRAYADETISRVKAVRSAFESATQINLGDTARNIAEAKKNLADAEKALTDAEAKFKNNVSVKAYEGVVINSALPIFQAEKDAVEKAKRDLAIALGSERNPFLATVNELVTALQNQYKNAVDLSTVSGQLAAAGFSQEFITQIISAGPDLGVSMGRAILAANTPTQNSLKTVFNSLNEVSKNGVNQLSVDLNIGAINAMGQFISGLSTVKDPLDLLIKAIEARVTAMVQTIADAIKAVMAQLAALSTIKPTVIGSGATIDSSSSKAADDAAKAADDYFKAAEDAAKNAAKNADDAKALRDQMAAKIAELKIATATNLKQVSTAVQDATATTLTSSQIASDMAMSILASKTMTGKLGGTTGVLSTARYTGQAIEWARQNNITINVTGTNLADPTKVATDTAWAIKTSSDVTYVINRADQMRAE